MRLGEVGRTVQRVIQFHRRLAIVLLLELTPAAFEVELRQFRLIALFGRGQSQRDRPFVRQFHVSPGPFQPLWALLRPLFAGRAGVRRRQTARQFALACRPRPRCRRLCSAALRTK